MENEKNIRRDNGKDEVRGKIILFVIGVLVGAVISTAAFFVYTLNLGDSNSGQTMQMQGGTPPEMPSGDNSSGGQGTPPEMPSGNNAQGSSTQSGDAQSN